MKVTEEERALTLDLDSDTYVDDHLLLNINVEEIQRQACANKKDDVSANAEEDITANTKNDVTANIKPKDRITAYTQNDITADTEDEIKTQHRGRKKRKRKRLTFPSKKRTKTTGTGQDSLEARECGAGKDTSEAKDTDMGQNSEETDEESLPLSKLREMQRKRTGKYDSTQRREDGEQSTVEDNANRRKSDKDAESSRHIDTVEDSTAAEGRDETCSGTAAQIIIEDPLLIRICAAQTGGLLQTTDGHFKGTSAVIEEDTPSLTAHSSEGLTCGVTLAQLNLNASPTTEDLNLNISMVSEIPDDAVPIQDLMSDSPHGVAESLFPDAADSDYGEGSLCDGDPEWKPAAGNNSESDKTDSDIIIGELVQEEDVDKEEQEKENKKREEENEEGTDASEGLTLGPQLERRERSTKRTPLKDRRKRDICFGRRWLYKGENRQRKIQPNPCSKTKCQHNCKTWPESSREAAFEHYWNLGDTLRQRDYIVAHVEETKLVKPKGQRKTTLKYKLDRGWESVPVCKQFFLATLNLGERTVYYALAHRTSQQTAGIDRRGSHVPKNKMPSDDLKFADDHIRSLPAVPSHYCRKSSSKLYLDSNLQSLSKVYRLYKKQCIQHHRKLVSQSTYRRLFNQYNIGFHHPKKDKCAVCEAHRLLPKAEVTPEVAKRQELHNQEKAATYAEHKSDQERCAADPAFACASFDLEKVLTTPHGNSGLLYYARKYAVYNLTIYESKTQEGHCNLWGEEDGMKGSTEVATCIFNWLKYITQERPQVQQITMYCDCCSGQNRNRQVIAMLLYAIKILPNVQELVLKYLLSGHTYMPVDSMHATIEAATKNATIWVPLEWLTIVRSARHTPFPYTADWMYHDRFFDWKDMQTQLGLSEEIDDSDERVKWAALRQVKVVKSENEDKPVFHMKYSFQQHAYRVVEVGRRSRRLRRRKADEEAKEPQPLVLRRAYSECRPIAEAKRRDLIQLCDKNIVPSCHHHVYRALNSNEAVRDCLPETDVDDSSEEEN